MSTFEKVRDIVVEQLGVEADEVAIESTFIDDLGADSLDIVELIMRHSLAETLRLRPDMVRIYPTVVLRDTALAAAYEAGSYEPLSLAAAVRIAAVMRVWLNPDKLAELGLTVANVTTAIKEQNIQAPAGTIGQLPAPADQEKQYTGKVQGRLVTAEDFGNVIIKSESNGSFVRLKDVARIETGAKTNNIQSKVNGMRAAIDAFQQENNTEE